MLSLFSRKKKNIVKKKPQTTRLNLEHLEERVVPAQTYSWVGDGGNNYASVSTNWSPQGNPGQDDTIKFGYANNRDCVMTAGMSVLAIDSKATYSGTIHLYPGGNRVLDFQIGWNHGNQGNNLSIWRSGSIISDGNGNQTGDENNLDIYTSNFQMDGGSIGATSQTMAVNVWSNAEMDFTQKTSGILWGADTWNNGTVKFPTGETGAVNWAKPTNGIQNPCFTNNGEVDFNATDTSDNTGGILYTANTAGIFFINTGTVRMTGGSGLRYHEDLPFYNGSTINAGQLYLENGTNMVIDGINPTTNLSYWQAISTSNTYLKNSAIFMKGNAQLDAGLIDYRLGTGNKFTNDNATGTLNFYANGGKISGNTTTYVMNATLTFGNFNLVSGGAGVCTLSYQTTVSGTSTFWSKIVVSNAFDITAGAFNLVLDTNAKPLSNNSWVSILDFGSCLYNTQSASWFSVTQIGAWTSWSIVNSLWWGGHGAGGYYLYVTK
jgi:hypothetical protein